LAGAESPGGPEDDFRGWDSEGAFGVRGSPWARARYRPAGRPRGWEREGGADDRPEAVRARRGENNNTPVREAGECFSLGRHPPLEVRAREAHASGADGSRAADGALAARFTSSTRSLARARTGTRTEAHAESRLSLSLSLSDFDSLAHVPRSRSREGRGWISRRLSAPADSPFVYPAGGEPPAVKGGEARDYARDGRVRQSRAGSGCERMPGRMEANNGFLRSPIAGEQSENTTTIDGVELPPASLQVWLDLRLFYLNWPPRKSRRYSIIIQSPAKSRIHALLRLASFTWQSLLPPPSLPLFVHFTYLPNIIPPLAAPAILLTTVYHEPL
jgi:hypothetical protein